MRRKGTCLLASQSSKNGICSSSASFLAINQLIPHRLQNKVIDLEVSAQTPSPTIDPSVRTILLGHSMGGIVAAETVLSILQDKPIGTSALFNESGCDNNRFMFPYIQGILAFDTPYLGIAPGVVAHGAEGQWNQASAAYNAYSTVANAFGWGSGSKTTAAAGSVADAGKMLPAPSAADADVATAPAWQRWGKYAMFAGAAGAVAAGGAAAWMNREQFSEGWKWAGSHLEFVGCLAKGEELKNRLTSVVKLEDEYGFGFADLYTCLGQAVDGKSQWFTGTLGEQRTFVTLPGPHGGLKEYFRRAVNDKATAEIWAHMSMFKPKDNPGYYHLIEDAKELIVQWTGNTWYEDADTVAGAGGDEEDDAEIVEKAEAEEEFETNFDTGPEQTL